MMQSSNTEVAFSRSASERSQVGEKVNFQKTRVWVGVEASPNIAKTGIDPLMK